MLLLSRLSETLILISAGKENTLLKVARRGVRFRALNLPYVGETGGETGGIGLQWSVSLGCDVLKGKDWITV